jgi:hypothetical protein
MIINCKNCNIEIVAKRSTKKFCSDACRIAYHRLNNPNYADWKDKNKRKEYNREYHQRKKQDETIDCNSMITSQSVTSKDLNTPNICHFEVRTGERLT